MNRSVLYKIVLEEVRKVMREQTEEVEKLPSPLRDLFEEIFENYPDLLDSLEEVRESGLNTEVVFSELVFDREVLLEIIQDPDFEEMEHDGSNVILVFSET